MFNWFQRKGEDYPLEAEQSANVRVRTIKTLLYLAMLAAVLTTAAHAILLVMTTTEAFSKAAQTGGLFYTILATLRVGWPVIIEIVAVGVGVGFLMGLWRGGQQSTGGAIEVLWALFAAANMITFFAIERGQELQGWQRAWVEYGLPLSALIVTIMTYRLLKNDPLFKRRNEEALGEERKRAAEHNARMAVKLSPEMQAVHARKVWREEVKALESEGYTPEEIAYVAAHIPEMEDMMKALEAGKATGASRPAREPATPSWWDRLRGRPPVGETTHDASRQDEAPQLVERPGQGQRTPVYANLAHLTPEALRQMAADLEAGRPATLNPNGQEVRDARPQ